MVDELGIGKSDYCINEWLRHDLIFINLSGHAPITGCVIITIINDVLGGMDSIPWIGLGLVQLELILPYIVQPRCMKGPRIFLVIER